MKAQQNIFLVGPMGAGKTSIGRALAKELNREFYDSDQVIEKSAGADILWIYDLEGEEGFRKREEKVIAELVQLRNIVLATGGSTVLSADNRAALASNGIVIYLHTSLDDQLRRTGFSKKRPLSNEIEERRDILNNLRQTYGPIYTQLADIVYDTDGKTTRAMITDLIKLVAEYSKSSCADNL